MTEEKRYTFNIKKFIKPKKSKSFILLFTVFVCIFLAYYINFIVGIKIPYTDIFPSNNVDTLLKYFSIKVIYTNLFYIPIILAAVWYRKKVVYLAIFLGLVHIYITYFSLGFLVIGTLERAAVLIIIAYVIALISEKRIIEEEKLKKSEEKYRSLVESADDSVYMINKNYRYLSANNKLLSQLGLLRHQVLGKTFGDFHSSKETKEFIEKVNQVFETGKAVRYESYDNLLNHWTIKTLSPIRNLNTGQVIAISIIARDITDRKQAEEEIRYLSFHDSLTGLYNRAYFEEEIKRLNTERNYPISIIMSDINDLKLVNDTLGHPQGDDLLKSLATLLKSVCRKEDIIARIGGDEFAIILPHTDENITQAFYNRIRDACKSYNNEAQLKLSIALGYATQSGQYKDIEEVLKRADNNMYHDKLSSSKSKEKYIIDTLKVVLATRDPHTEKHAERLQDLAEALGKDINLPESKLKKLRLLALLHDTGKIGTPDAILFKPDKLTPEEWEIMKKHAEEGYRIAKNIPQLVSTAEDILHHHERWNGRGYPDRLKGKKIPILSRIISIVDAYDAMLSNRPYRKSLSKEEAIEELKKNAGTQFDPELVEKFLKILKTTENQQ